MVALSPAFNWASTNVRSYSVAIPALTIAFLLIPAILKSYSSMEPAARRLALLCGYCLALVVAVWCHLLAAPLIVLLCCCFFGGVMRLSAEARRRAIIECIVAHLVVALLFAPWLFHLRSQLEYLEGAPTPWMHPPTGRNVFLTFFYWFPSGAVHDMPVSPRWWLLTLGIAAYLLPGYYLLTHRHAVIGSHALYCCLAGFAMAAAWILMLAGVTVMGVAKVFHGSRYALMAAPIWSASMGFAAAHIYQSTRKSIPVLIMVLPAAIASLTGNLIQLEHESNSGLGYWLARVKMRPPPGERIYINPPSLESRFAKTLAGYDVVRVQDVAAIVDNEKSVWIINGNPWQQLYSGVEDAILNAVSDPELQGHFTVQMIPPPEVDDEFFLCFIIHFDNVDPAKLRRHFSGNP